MYVLENLKKKLENITGVGKPARPPHCNVRPRKPHARIFKNDGEIPNNPELAFIHYRSPLRLPSTGDAAALFEALFERNGWGDCWRNGIYDYPHYHSRTHEVLGIARGRARVRFGGAAGKTFELKPGDVAVLPAGTGHQLIAGSKDLLVVGAYPPSGKYDECTGSPDEHRRALARIPRVPLPKRDPVYGAAGPVLDVWRRRKTRERRNRSASL